MAIYYVLGCMGSGKTLCATLYAIEYAQKNPNNKIYANYHLKLNNFQYTPFGFLPFSELHDCLIILDDYYAIAETLNGLTAVIVNFSRKQNISVILTAQYYTMIPKKIRDISTQILVRYNTKLDLLVAFVEKKDRINDNVEFTPFFSRKAVERASRYYDTKEVVKMASEERLAEEILRNSKSNDDIEDNVNMAFRSTTTRERIKKIIEKNRILQNEMEHNKQQINGGMLND